MKRIKLRPNPYINTYISNDTQPFNVYIDDEIYRITMYNNYEL